MGYFGFSWFLVGSYYSNYVNYFTLEKKVKFNQKGKRSKESKKKFALLKRKNGSKTKRYVFVIFIFLFMACCSQNIWKESAYLKRHSD